MKTAIERALNELGYTNFRIINEVNDPMDYDNVIRWIIDDEETMDPDAAPVDWETVEPAFDLIVLRDKRNELLAECDWTQYRDVTLANDEDWQTYRQALRDITDNYSSIHDDGFSWPEKP